jgi:hypothetical protein
MDSNGALNHILRISHLFSDPMDFAGIKRSEIARIRQSSPRITRAFGDPSPLYSTVILIH